MEKLRIQAPIQVRPDTVHRHERLFPLLAAEAVNRLHEYHSGREIPRVDVWNTVGHKLDVFSKMESGSSFAENREDMIKEQIRKRYIILSNEYGIETSNRKCVRDDQPDFEEVVTKEISRMLVEGKLKVISELFHACADCNQVIAPIQVSVRSCPNCHGSHLEVTEKVGLFLLMTDQTKKWLIDSIVVNPNSSKGYLKSGVNSIPAGIQISKDRVTGVDLSQFGVDPRFKLDPKIALAMTHIVLREMGYGDVEEYFLGRNVLANFAPFVKFIDPGSDIQHTTLNLVPPYSAEDVDNHGSGVYMPFLALAVLGSSDDLGIDQLKALIKERAKLSRKLKSIQTVFEELRVPLVSEGDPTADLGEFVSPGNPRRGMLEFRNHAFNELSRSIVPDMKSRGYGPSTDYQDALQRVSDLLYG